MELDKQSWIKILTDWNFHRTKFNNELEKYTALIPYFEETELVDNAILGFELVPYIFGDLINEVDLVFNFLDATFDLDGVRSSPFYWPGEKEYFVTIEEFVNYFYVED